MFCARIHDMATNLVGLGEDGLHDRDEVGFVGKVWNIEQSLELLQTNGDGCTGHESNNGCVGQKCGDEPQPATQAIQGSNSFISKANFATTDHRCENFVVSQSLGGSYS